MKKLLFTSLILIAITQVSAQEKAGVVTNVSVGEFKTIMDSLKGEVVVDLRTPDELKQGQISGAIVIDYFGPDFEPAIEKLDKNKVYLLYCAGGGRSSETAELLSQMGFKKIYNLESGFNGWVRKKMPIQSQ